MSVPPCLLSLLTLAMTLGILGCGETVVVIITPTPLPTPTPVPTPRPLYVPDATPITGAYYESPIASYEGWSGFLGEREPEPPKCPIGTPIPFEEAKRRLIFQAIVLAEDMASVEADKTGAHETEYYPYLYAMVTRRFDITLQQLHCIGKEGEEYWWPLPPEYKP